MLVPLAFAALGLVVGVFIEGVVASYVREATFWPWPHCRACGRASSPRGLVPVFGPLVERQCRGCGRSVWARALQVEAVTGVVFFLFALRYSDVPLMLIAGPIAATLLIAILFIDLEVRLIPTLLIALLVLFGLGMAMLPSGTGLGPALLGGAIGFGSFGLLFLLARLVFGEGAFGMGDANLALAIGCLTGYPLTIVALACGVFIGGVGAVAVMIVGRRGMRSTIPYGPYLVIGVLYAMLYGSVGGPIVVP